MTTRRTPIAALLAGFTLATSPAADAVVLGEVVSVSAIGQPVRIEIRNLDGRVDDAGECLRVTTATDNDSGLPNVGHARISAVGSGPTAHIVVSSPMRLHEPAAQLTIENVCNANLRKQYTLLLAYPESSTAEVSPPVSAPRPRTTVTPTREPASQPAARTAQAATRWKTAPGETLSSLAATLYPDDTATQQRFIAAAARANPEHFPDRASREAELPAGTELIIPSLRRATRAPQEAPAARRTPAPPDRLVVAEPTADKPSTAATQGARPTGPADANWSARERELATAVDRTIVAQMELIARIKELEQIQAELEARAARLGVNLPGTPIETAPPPAPVETPQAVTASPRPVEAPQPEAPEPQPEHVGNLGLIGGLGVLALGLIVLLLRRRKHDNVLLTQPEPAALSRLSVAEPPLTEQVDPRQLRENLTHIGGTAPLEWDGQTPQHTRSLAPLSPVDEEVEEHDSAIELAEIMMSFGRVHGAAETLADFIRNNPKQAVTPWLKLLEVYRAAGLRAEFDGLARQLNKTFNVKTVNWENFEEARSAPDTLEKLPHILGRLQETWGTRDCQAYLHTLLRDNRDGTRQGFPLNVVDELLLLSAILEQHLGVYRPELETAPESVAQETLA